MVYADKVTQEQELCKTCSISCSKYFCYDMVPYVVCLFSINGIDGKGLLNIWWMYFVSCSFKLIYYNSGGKYS